MDGEDLTKAIGVLDPPLLGNKLLLSWKISWIPESLIRERLEKVHLDYKSGDDPEKVMSALA